MGTLWALIFTFRAAALSSVSGWGFRFYGVSDIHEPELLSVDEENDASDGIAIALFNESGELVKLNQPPENWVHLTRGDMKLHMQARYKATHYPVTGERQMDRYGFL